MLGLDLDDLLQFGLVEVLPSILQDILRLFLQNLKQKHRHHVLQFGMLPEIGLIIDPILHLLLIEQPNLGRSEPLDASDIMRVIVLLLIVHIADLVAVDLVLLLLVHVTKIL